MKPIIENLKAIYWEPLANFSDAKKEVEIAINLYGRKKPGFGIAVSRFDLARIYEHEHKLDSAIYYCDTALIFWGVFKQS